MAAQIGVPGQSARLEGYERLFGPPVVVFIVFGALSPLLAWALNDIPAFSRWIAILLGLAITFAWARKDILATLKSMAGAHNWSKGADGEQATAGVLAALPDAFAVIHDFHPLESDGSAAAWNVDHIVVGPTGIFVLDTKNYSAPRVPPANRSPYTRRNVAQAQRNAAELKAKLARWSGGALADVFVVPVLVYVQPNAFVEKTREGFARVLPLKWLEREITQQTTRRQLTSDEILRTANVLFSQMAPHLQEAFRPELQRLAASIRANGQSRPGDTTPHESGNPHVDTSGADARAAEAASPVCPRCGGTLTERVARKGPREGKHFLGCSNFRELGCRYTLELGD